jgi:hypothetical protein
MFDSAQKTGNRTVIVQSAKPHFASGESVIKQARTNKGFVATAFDLSIKCGALG